MSRRKQDTDLIVHGKIKGRELEQFFGGYGVRVVVEFKKSSPFGRVQSTYHNVTEIHKDYSRSSERRIAFESEVHMTGITQPIAYIESVKIVGRELAKHRSGF